MNGKYISVPFTGARDSMRIEGDECISMKQIHINVYGEIHPCCGINDASRSPIYQERSEYEKFMLRDSDNWMNLAYHTLDEIMGNDWWDKLYATFPGTCDTSHLCITKCGVKK